MSLVVAAPAEAAATVLVVETDPRSPSAIVTIRGLGYKFALPAPTAAAG